MPHARNLFTPLVFLVAVTAPACLDFREETPEGPSQVVVPRTVSVTIEYTQLSGCVNVETPCEDEPVVFFASWMRQPLDGGPGQALVLTPDPRTYVWRGVATGVPVNYPPGRTDPYRVWVFDPHFREAPTQGGTGERMKVGGEVLNRFATDGLSFEPALVFIDEAGRGHNPF